MAQIDQRTEQINSILTQYMQSTNAERQIQKLAEPYLAGHENFDKTFSFNLDDFRNLYPDYALDLIQQPRQYLRHLQIIVQDKVQENINQNEGGQKKKSNLQEREQQFRVTYEGNIGKNLVTPRGLNANLVNKFIGVQGIVSKITLIKPKLTKSVHYCEKTEKGTVKTYEDDFDVTTTFNPNQSKSIPLKDNDGNPLNPEFGYWNFKDFQTIVIQELPEKAPTGLLPKSIEVIVEEDLVDKVKPGDRVEILGVYKCIASQKTVNQGIFTSKLIATKIRHLQEEQNQELTQKDITNIRSMPKEIDSLDILELFAKSIAPSIYGHEHIKRSILLQLLGGEEKIANDVHLRGDINILLIGDPSTAKSQMLRYVLNIAPLALNTTGRGATGVGLTAAVKVDPETGQRSLEAGAMVLADRGIVCIDEFDKMNEGDRVAIHEAMEQQTVTIAKAGIHCQLNARCSVIAAANPIYGEYQIDLPPTKNIGLPDSLLSRFDLLFIIRDERDSQQDTKIAERVTKNHRFKAVNQEGQQFLMNDDEEYYLEPQIQSGKQNKDKNKEVYNTTDQLYNRDDKVKVFTQEFLKGYISYVKKFCHPLLTDDSIEYLANAWKNLRQKDLQDKNSTGGVKVLPITVRTYETLIRLSTAHAKLRQSKLIERIDCFQACKLLSFSLFKDENEDWYDPLEEYYKDEDEFDGDDDEDGDDQNEGDSEFIAKKKAEKKKKRLQKKGIQKKSSKKNQMEQEDIEEVKQSHIPTRRSEQQQQKQPTQQQQQQQQQIQNSNQIQTRHSGQKQPQQTQQQQQLQNKSKQKQDVRLLEEGVKKIRFDDGQDFNYTLNMQMIKQIEVKDKDKKYVFKTLVDIMRDEDSIEADKLWLNVKDQITNQNLMYAILLQLEDEGKFMLNPDEQPIKIYRN